MATLLHVTGDGHEPLAAFAGHLVRNLEWDRYSPEAVDAAVDTVVASPAGPGDAVRLVADLREAGRHQTVFLIEDGSPGWSSVEHAFQDVHVVADLVDLRRALGAEAPPEVETVTDPAEQDGPRRHVPRGGTRGLLKERLGDGTVNLRQSMSDFDRQMEADGLRDVPAPQVVQQPGPPPGVPEDAAEEVTGAVAAPRPPVPRREQASRRDRRETADPDALVAGLLEVVDRLYGVRETGTAVAGHVKDLVGVDAVAVLVPDGAVWTVAGAVGHRHLEERLTLTADHWLVHEVALVHHGVIIEDTDIVRSRLAGAPLAAWPHLMACPLVDVMGTVVLARSDNGPPFSSRDLARASEALREAGPLFASAVQVRGLARRLTTLAELDDPGSA